MQRILFGLLLSVVACAAHAQSVPKKFQCWTDEKGQRACGDRVPPQYAKEQRQVFDSQGRVIETRERQKTPEEIAEAERQAAEAAEVKRQQEAEAAYDRFLRDSYSSVKDLERARNERLATLDGRSNLARQAVEGDEKSKAQLQSRIELQTKNGKPVEDLQKQMRAVDKTLRENRAGIEQMQKDRERVCAEFLRDILRYQELTMGGATYVGECPAPGSPALALPVVKPKPAAPTDKSKNKKKPPKKPAKKPAD
jgi:hypothetical protein